MKILFAHLFIDSRLAYLEIPQEIAGKSPGNTLPGSRFSMACPAITIVPGGPSAPFLPAAHGWTWWQNRRVLSNRSAGFCSCLFALQNRQSRNPRQNTPPLTEPLFFSRSDVQKQRHSASPRRSPPTPLPPPSACTCGADTGVPRARTSVRVPHKYGVQGSKHPRRTR